MESKNPRPRQMTSDPTTSKKLVRLKSPSTKQNLKTLTQLGEQGLSQMVGEGDLKTEKARKFLSLA